MLILKTKTKMRKVYCLLIPIIFSFVASAQIDRTIVPEAGPAPVIKIGEYDLFTLENGMKVIVVENHKLPRVSFSLTLDYQSVFEGDRVGYISLAGQLLNTGTSNRTKAELDEEIDFIGASFSASATGVFASSLTKHKAKLLELMTDVLFNPSFPPEELDKLKKQTISGLAAYKENANSIASSVGDVIRYGKDHPYGEITTEETIQPITIEECKQFYETYFRPNIAYLTIVGDITKEEVEPLVNKYFSNWKQGEVSKNPYTTPQKPKNTKVVFIDRPQSVQSVVVLTYPLELKPGTEDVIPARVMNTILGGGFSSNLNQNLREEHAYTYGARSSLSNDRLIGSFSVSTSVRNEVTDSTIFEIINELNEIRDNPVDEEQLQSIKNYLTGGFARSLERPQTVARFALNIERYNLPKDYYANYLKKLNAVTVEEVQTMAKKYIHPENAYILVVGKKDEVAESLTKFGEVNYYDIYGDPEKSFTSDIDPYEVIQNYLEKIGGETLLESIKSVRIVGEADFQGMTFSVESVKATPNRSINSISLGENMMQKRIYDNGKAKVFVQGNSVPVSDKDIKAMKNSSRIFPELDFGNEGFILSIKGIKKVGSEEAYQIFVTYPDGTEISHFYGINSGLKLKTESESEGEITYSDYTDYEGVLMPSKTTANTGQGYLIATIKQVEINIPVSDDLFE